MISMQKILNNVKVLEGWDGCNVEPRIEENPEEIWMLIKYSNHGDEYLVVGTRDGMMYEYGCYVNHIPTHQLNIQCISYEGRRFFHLCI